MKPFMLAAALILATPLLLCVGCVGCCEFEFRRHIHNPLPVISRPWYHPGRYVDRWRHLGPFKPDHDHNHR